MDHRKGVSIFQNGARKNFYCEKEGKSTIPHGWKGTANKSNWESSHQKIHAFRSTGEGETEARGGTPAGS